MTIRPTQHEQVNFFAGTDRRLLFTVDEVPDLNDPNAIVWNLVSGHVDELGRPTLYGSALPVLVKNLDDGITVVDTENRIVQVRLSADETAPLEGWYYDELKVFLGANIQDVVSYGNFMVVPTGHAVL